MERHLWTQLELEPSIDGTKEKEKERFKCHTATSIDQATELTGKLMRHVMLPTSSQRNYAEIVQGSKMKSFKMTIKSSYAHPPEKN